MRLFRYILSIFAPELKPRSTWNLSTHNLFLIKASWFCDLIWRDSSWSILVHVVACWLTVPRHYTKQCWLSSVSTKFANVPIEGNVRKTHYSDVIMSAMARQITGISIVYSKVCSGAYKKNVKIPRHWPFRGVLTGCRWIPRIKGQWRKNVSIWRRHHACMWPYTISHGQAIWNLYLNYN